MWFAAWFYFINGFSSKLEEIVEVDRNLWKRVKMVGCSLTFMV